MVKEVDGEIAADATVAEPILLEIAGSVERSG